MCHRGHGSEKGWLGGGREALAVGFAGGLNWWIKLVGEGLMFGALHCWIVSVDMFQQAQYPQNIRVIDRIIDGL